jgi:hypothetical protein
MPYGFLLSTKTLCPELVNITKYFWKLLLHQDAGFHYIFYLFVLLAKHHEDAGNVVDKAADGNIFQLSKRKEFTLNSENLRRCNKPSLINLVKTILIYGT